eukprot:gene5970-biopygen11810
MTAGNGLTAVCNGFAVFFQRGYRCCSSHGRRPTVKGEHGINGGIVFLKARHPTFGCLCSASLWEKRLRARPGRVRFFKLYRVGRVPSFPHRTPIMVSRDSRWETRPTLRSIRAPGPRAAWGRARGTRRGFARRDAPREIPKFPPPPSGACP